jgi:hypothetical protein
LTAFEFAFEFAFLENFLVNHGFAHNLLPEKSLDFIFIVTQPCHDLHVGCDLATDVGFWNAVDLLGDFLNELVTVLSLGKTREGEKYGVIQERRGIFFPEADDVEFVAGFIDLEDVGDLVVFGGGAEEDDVLIDRDFVLPMESHPIVERSQGHRGLRSPASLEFDVEDAACGFEKADGIGADRFDAEFGFENFDVFGGMAEYPGGDFQGMGFGDEFAEVVVGHGLEVRTDDFSFAQMFGQWHLAEGGELGLMFEGFGVNRSGNWCGVFNGKRPCIVVLFADQNLKVCRIFTDWAGHSDG